METEISGVEGTALSTAPPLPERSNERRDRILVVNDDEALRRVLVDLLTSEGCEVQGAENGAAALEVLQRWRPDVILLDLKMPTMDGASFVAAYNMTAEPHAPIVVLTGGARGAEIAEEIGAAGFITEPFSIADLFKIVSAYADCVAAGSS